MCVIRTRYYVAGPADTDTWRRDTEHGNRPAPAAGVKYKKEHKLIDGDTMSMATRTDTQSPALHAADSHDLIRVHGARVNNLKDVSVEIPKRQLTMFTGISGSGKS